MTPADDPLAARSRHARFSGGDPPFQDTENADRFPQRDEPCSAASVWRIVSHGIPENILSLANRLAIGRGIVRLPAFSGMILERPFESGTPEVDLSLCATPKDGGQEMLAGLDPRWPFPHPWLQNAAWAGVRNFCRRWLAEGTHLHRQVQSVWLEFDRPQLQAAPPLPCFFVNTRAAPAGLVPEVVAATVEPFLEPAEKAQAATLLRRVLPHLTAQSVVEFVGVMSSRNPVTVRLCLSLPALELNRFLTGIGLPLDDRSDRASGFAARHAQEAVLHLDLGPDFGANLGVEVKPANPREWPNLLMDAWQEGLCGEAERAALLRIPTKAAICRAGRKLGDFEAFSFRSGRHWNDIGAFMFFRRINHLKLTWGTGRRLGAKAYIHIGYQWKWRPSR